MDPLKTDRDSSTETAVHSTEGSAQDIGLPEEEQIHFQARLLDAVGQAVIATDTQGNVIYWNRAAEDLYGWSQEEAMGRSIVEVTPSEVLMEQAEEIMGELMAGKSWSGEFMVRRKDGTSFPAMVTDTPVLDEAGNVVAIIGVSTDITEIKETEELRRSEERFRLLVEEVKDYAIFMLDAEGCISSWNIGAQRINGYTSEEIIGRHFSVFYLPEDIERGHPEEELRLAKEQGRYEEEGLRVRKDGSRFWASVLITALLDEEGNLRGFSKVVRDITERKEAEEEKARRARYATLRAEVSTTLAEGGSLQSILQRCAKCMVQHLDVAFARIWTLNEEENMLELEASAGMYTHLDGPHSRVPVGSFKIGLIAQERLPHLSNDVANDLRIHDKEWTKREGMEAFAGYPLMVENQVVGVMAMFSREPLREDTIEALESVADTIAQGIQRKRIVEALGESEERFRLLAENAQDLVYRFRFKPTPAFEYVSPSSTAIMGYSPEEYYADPELGLKIAHPEDRHLIDKALRHPESPLSIRSLRKDGRVVWTEQRNKPIYDEAGELVAVEGIARDVTERKEAEEALRSSEEFFRALYENAQHPIFLLDRDLKFVDVNPYACEFYGYSREEFRRMKVSDITLPEEHDDQLRNLERARKGGRVFIHERRHRKKNGEIITVTADAGKVTRTGQELYVSKITDITERKRAEEQLHYQAFHDLLTGLPNRYLLLDRLGQALKRTRRPKSRHVALLFMDLNNFKAINDSLGHEVGDTLLIAVAERLRSCLRPEDNLVRFGGDEFAVLLEHVGNPEDAVRVVERITEELREPFALDGRELFVRISIGVAVGESRTKSAEDLIRDADTAMYRAKEEGSDYRVFDPQMYLQAIGRLELENDLRRAIEGEEEEFALHYQPIVNLRSGEVSRVEALVRWNHPERGLLTPSDFLTVVEESGLIVPMGERVLDVACRQAKEWHEKHPGVAPLLMSVNLSARQLRRPDLATTIEEILQRTGFDAQCLSLDITETVYIKVLEGNTRALDDLKKLGVKVSIDDFGVGYSSLAYLKRLPADVLKIDKSFVKGLGEDVEDTAIVGMVIELAHTLGMEVIAEGVESEEQAALLEEMGCDMAQGFYIAAPLPAEEASEFLARKRAP